MIYSELEEIIKKCEHVTVLNIPAGCALVFHMPHDIDPQEVGRARDVVQDSLLGTGIKTLFVASSIRMTVARIGGRSN